MNLFSSNWKLPFLDLKEVENVDRKYFMIRFHKVMCPSSDSNKTPGFAGRWYRTPEDDTDTYHLGQDAQHQKAPHSDWKEQCQIFYEDFELIVSSVF